MTIAKSGMITKICVPNFPIKQRASRRRDFLPAIRGNATSCDPCRTTGIAPNLRRFLPARCLRLRELSVTGAIAEMVKTSFQSSFLVGTEPFLSFRAKAEESLTIDENKVRDVSTHSRACFAEC